MSYIVAKRIGQKTYYYKVRSYRKEGKVMQEILEYYGLVKPADYSVEKSIIEDKIVEVKDVGYRPKIGKR
jgi:hypothetical protein